MKTWQTAEVAHTRRIETLEQFGAVLRLLASHGAPPPDDIWAGHADWATDQGVFRIALSRDGSDLMFPGNKTSFPTVNLNEFLTGPSSDIYKVTEHLKAHVIDAPDMIEDVDYFLSHPIVASSACSPEARHLPYPAVEKPLPPERYDAIVDDLAKAFQWQGITWDDAFLRSWLVEVAQRMTKTYRDFIRSNLKVSK